MIDISEIRERCGKATPGPWKFRCYTSGGSRISDEATDKILIADIYGIGKNGTGNSEFIFNTITDIPKLIDEVECLQHEYESLRYENVLLERDNARLTAELKNWHTDKHVPQIKHVFANTSTLCCHNCDHKDEYIMELETMCDELARYEADEAEETNEI